MDTLIPAGATLPIGVDKGIGFVSCGGNGFGGSSGSGSW